MAVTANQELIAGLKNWHYWLGLGWSDIKRRYVRTVLGPWWSVINAVIFIGAVSFVYASLFKQELAEIMPHLATGYFVWMLITNVTNEAAPVLHAQGIIIKTSPIRPISFILRMLSRNIMIFGHNFILLFLMALVYSINLGLFPLSLLGIFILLCFLAPWAIIISIACCRFRDLEQMIGSILMVLFFATPILWKPDRLEGIALDLVQWNFFYHFIEIIRRPILGELPTALNYSVAIGVTAATLILGIWLYSSTRRQLAFWF